MRGHAEALAYGDRCGSLGAEACVMAVATCALLARMVAALTAQPTSTPHF